MKIADGEYAIDIRISYICSCFPIKCFGVHISFVWTGASFSRKGEKESVTLASSQVESQIQSVIGSHLIDTSYFTSNTNQN